MLSKPSWTYVIYRDSPYVLFAILQKHTEKAHLSIINHSRIRLYQNKKINNSATITNKVLMLKTVDNK